MLSMLLACEARDPRRERRWQIHAHQDAGCSHPAFIRRTLSQRQENRAGKSRRRAPPWRRDGLPRNQLGSFADRRSKSLLKRRQAVQSPPGHLHRRPAIPAVAQFPGRSRCRGIQSARVESRWSRLPVPFITTRRLSFSTSDGDADSRRKSSVLLTGCAPSQTRRIDHSSSPMPSKRLCKSRIGSRSCVTANM